MELYQDDLNTLLELLDRVEDLAMVNGVSEVEIRVRVNDESTWAILGYGESGNPCILRFEEDKKPEPPKNNVFTINHSSVSPWASGSIQATPLVDTHPSI